MTDRSALHVLCAADGSPASRQALEFVQELGLLPDSILRLLYVSEFGVSFAAGLTALELPEDRGEAVLEHLRREVVSPSWGAVHFELLRGRPADTILLAANRHRADLIALGAHGRAEIQPCQLGSVLRRIVLYASCSVLVVKRPVVGLDHVVIGIDGSQEAQNAAEFLLRLSLPAHTRVTVAAVIPPFPHGPASGAEGHEIRLQQILGEVENEARRGVTQVVETLQASGCRAEGAVVFGHPAQELLKLVESLKAELVVVGSRGLTGDKRYLMGSVSDTVVLYAPCAVLVFRQQAKGDA